MLKTLAELLDEPPERSDWGPWLLDRKLYVLHLPDDRYWFDLAGCTTPVVVLDWIFQVAAKTWADHRVVAGLVAAFDDILHPQATLCSFGEYKTLTSGQVKQTVDRLPAAWFAGGGG